MRRKLFSRKGDWLCLLLLILPWNSNADTALPAEGSVTLLESFGPLSSSPRDDQNKNTLFLGGVFRKEDEDTYRRLLNTGASPASIPGPEGIYLAENNGAAVSEVKLVFSQEGFHVNDPATFRLPSSSTLYLIFTRVENQTVEECRKKGESLRSCAAYAYHREIGLASSETEGRSWNFQRVLIPAQASGDGEGAAQPSALFTGTELWVYYVTGRQLFMKENIYRSRFSSDGSKRLAPPESVKLEGFSPGLSLQNIQLVRLRCLEGGKSLFTMVANTREMNAIPFYLSFDGLNFKLASPNAIPYSGRNLLSPTQMPGPASVEECHATSLSGVSTFRELLYAEQDPATSRWRLRQARVKLTFP